VNIVKLSFEGRGEEEKFKSEVTTIQTASHKNAGLKEQFLNKDFSANVKEFKYLNLI
jgi:hypothetical protein